MRKGALRFSRIGMVNRANAITDYRIIFARELGRSEVGLVKGHADRDGLAVEAAGDEKGKNECSFHGVASVGLGGGG